MPDRNDAQLETLLREHFAVKLDGQLGRAGERFAREAAQQASRPPLRLTTDAPPRSVSLHARRRSGWSAFGWSIGIAGAAVAAGIAIVAVLGPMLANHRPANPNVIVDGGSMRNPRNGEMHLPSNAGNDAAGVEPLGPQNVEHALAWRTVDQGTVYLGGGEVPLRSVVRQADETVRWYDPRRRAQVELTVPRNEVMLVEYGSQ